MTDKTDLKPCPLCRADAKITKAYWKKGGWHPAKIQCANWHTFRCNSPMQADKNQVDAALDELVTAWNTRPDKTDSAALIAGDAARYRWLRDVSVPPHNFYIGVPDEFAGVKYTANEVDSYIDQAIRASMERDGGEAP